MKCIFKFEIAEATPSNNEVMRMHHRERTREHERVTWIVRQVIGYRKTALDKCKMRVTRHGEKLLDWDNMGGGLKFLNDAMVKNKLIIDDKPSCILKLELDQVKCRKAEQKTVIELFKQTR